MAESYWGIHVPSAPAVLIALICKFYPGKTDHIRVSSSKYDSGKCIFWNHKQNTKCFSKISFTNLLLEKISQILSEELIFRVFPMALSTFTWIITSNITFKRVSFRSNRAEVFWKHAANLQENTHWNHIWNHIEILKSRFGMGVLL